MRHCLSLDVAGLFVVGDVHAWVLRWGELCILPSDSCVGRISSYVCHNPNRLQCRRSLAMVNNQPSSTDFSLIIKLKWFSDVDLRGLQF